MKEVIFEITTPTVDFDVGGFPTVDFDIGSAVIVGSNYYEGVCEATPSSEEQVFSTNGKMMPENFVVHPIPSNYGLITYNGYDITVS